MPLTAEDVNHANIARLRLLIADAETNMRKMEDAGNRADAMHYAGMRDGLKRAIDVLEGRG